MIVIHRCVLETWRVHKIEWNGGGRLGLRPAGHSNSLLSAVISSIPMIFSGHTPTILMPLLNKSIGIRASPEFRIDLNLPDQHRI